MEYINNSKTRRAKTLKILTSIRYMLRIGIACTFTGHGMSALAVKQNWIPLLTVYGFSVEQARTMMPVIGVLDIFVALLVLIHPFRAIVIWAVAWTFATALTRFIAGEGVWEFIERAANWSAPLALFLLNDVKVDQKTNWIEFSKKIKEKPRFIPLMKKFPFFLLSCFL
jgi:hypothetical protein